VSTPCLSKREVISTNIVVIAAAASAVVVDDDFFSHCSCHPFLLLFVCFVLPSLSLILFFHETNPTTTCST
jgi:hypothetical protein